MKLTLLQELSVILYIVLNKRFEHGSGKWLFTWLQTVHQDTMWEKTTQNQTPLMTSTVCSEVNSHFQCRWSPGVNGECIFPEYLQSPLDEFGEPMAWQTKMWWLNLRNDPKLREKQDVYVQRSQIWSQRQNNRRTCDRMSRRVAHRATASSFGNCSERYLLYNRTCLIEESFGRFRVIQYGPGRNPTFLCIKFTKRSDNVVQVYEGPAKDYNDPELCDERSLILDEWPWIAPWKGEISNCPISGGFSFRTVNRLTNEDFCEDEWRRSRLEIDCSKGDGLNFIAPKGSLCNPFSSTDEATRFYCWAGWNQKHHTFLVVGPHKGVPQYCLRFPRDINSEFKVIVYFSVLCPIEQDGMPPTGIEYHELKMKTINPEKCLDDDPLRCEQILNKGACKKEDKYAFHCPASCKICEEKQETICPFSPKIIGSWLLIDRFHKEHVKINHTMISFSQYGSFVCKERSLFSENLYKTVSYFRNGCARRYTCFEFVRRNNNILQFRVGKSHRSDTTLDTMCKFEEDDLPVKGKHRSKTMKYLILDGRLWDEFCGLSSSIPFNGTIYGEPCSGTVSDWDDDGCVIRGNLALRSNSCRNLQPPMDFQCLALISDHPLEQFLITKNRENGEYNCWVVTSFLCQHWSWRYRAMYKLDSPQCVTLSESACIRDNPPEALLYLHDEEKTKICKHERTPRPGLFTSTPTLSKLLPRTTGINKWPYHLPENSGVSATVYQMDGTHEDGSMLGSKNNSEIYRIYSALRLHITLLILHIVLYVT